MDAAAASAAAAIRALLQRQSVDGAGRRHGRAGPREPKPAAAPTIRSSRCRRTPRGRSSPALDAGGRRARRWPSGPSWRSTARRRCRPRSASTRLGRALAQGGEEPAASRAAADADRRAQVAHPRRRGARAVIRALLYVGMTRAPSTSAASRPCADSQAHGDMPLADFKALVREQFNMLLIDQEAALAAIPSMLPPDRNGARPSSSSSRCWARAVNRPPEDQQATERDRPAVRRRRAVRRAAGPNRACARQAS